MSEIVKPFVLGEIDQAEKEQLRFLRTNFLRAAEEAKARTVLVGTDRCPQETAEALLKFACALTAVGKSVLVVDLDRINASVSSLLKISPKDTFHSYLAGKSSADKLPQKTAVENLSVICSEVSHAEQLGDDLPTRKLIDALKSGYDFVFLSGTPCDMGADVFSFDEIADAVMLVVKQKKTTHKFLKTVLEYYARRDTKVLGIMMI